MGTIIPLLTEFEKEHISERQALPEKYLGLSDAEMETRIAAARQKLGDLRVYYMNEQRGASNGKAKRAFGWQPTLPSWQAGFEALYRGADRPRQPSDGE